MPIWISYLNFQDVLTLPKTARSAQTHKSMSFIWIFWSTLYVYVCPKGKKLGTKSVFYVVVVIWTTSIYHFLKLEEIVISRLQKNYIKQMWPCLRRLDHHHRAPQKLRPYETMCRPHMARMPPLQPQLRLLISLWKVINSFEIFSIQSVGRTFYISVLLLLATRALWAAVSIKRCSSAGIFTLPLL